MILSVNSNPEDREEAEGRIMEQVTKSGVLVCHGDLLIKERFESCKRLKQGSTSSFERYEFMPLFVQVGDVSSQDE